MHFTHPGQDGRRHHQQKDAEKARTVPTARRSSFLSLSSLYAYPSLSYLSDAPMSHSNSSRPSTSQNSPQHSQTIARGASKTPAQKEDIPHLLSFLRRRRWRGWGRECECVCVRGGRFKNSQRRSTARPALCVASSLYPEHPPEEAWRGCTHAAERD